MTEAKTGREAGFYISVSGDFALPVYVELDVAKDISMERNFNSVQDDCRRDGKDAKFVPTQRTHQIDIEVCHRTADAAWQALRDAKNNCSEIELMKLDCKNTEPGAEGIRFMEVPQSSQCNQPLNEPQNDACSFVPSGCSATDIEYVTIP